jgi:predicted DNA-binding transcriptional regulator AlpA
MSDQRPLAKPAEIANYLGKPVSTLRVWRQRRLGPPWLKVGPRDVRYRWSDVEQWLSEQVSSDRAS